MSLSRVYKASAVVLKRINVGESDRIITLFTKQYGKIRCIAKGIRKITSRRSSHLDLFNEIQVTIHKGKTLDIVSEVVAIRMRRDVLSSWIKIKSAYLVAEVIDKLIPDNEPQYRVYALLDYIFEEIGKSGEAEAEQLLCQFFRDVLIDLGYLNREKEMKSLTEIIPYIEHITERKIRSSKFSVP